MTLTTQAMVVSKMYLRKYINSSTRRCFSPTIVRLADAGAGGDGAEEKKEEAPKPEFFVPRAERGTRNVFLVDALLGEARLNRNDRTCPTRELNFTPANWGSHKSPWRRIRHVAIHSEVVRSSD
jgi:hypothetical protein